MRSFNYLQYRYFKQNFEFKYKNVVHAMQKLFMNTPNTFPVRKENVPPSNIMVYICSIYNIANTAVTSTNHFIIFLSKLHNVFSMSAKKQRQLKDVTNNLNEQVMRIGAIFAIRIDHQRSIEFIQCFCYLVFWSNHWLQPVCTVTSLLDTLLQT